MLKTRSDALLVWVVNTAAAGGSAVVVTNSSDFFITNTNLSVVVTNSGGLVNPWFVRQNGSAFATSQISIGTTPTLIVNTNNSRLKITIINTTTANIWLGNSSVNTANGQLLAGIVGYPASIRTTAPLFGIIGSGNQLVSYLEEST